MKRARTTLAVLAACAIALLAVGAGSANILPPQANAHGTSLSEWAKQYFKFEASVPVVDGSHPGIDVGAVDCSVGQHGKVWFLATSPDIDGDIVRTCTIPTGTTLYMPVLQWVCVPELDGVPVPECLAQSDDAIAAVDISLTVDGRTLDNEQLQAYRAPTGAFELPLVEDGFWEWVTGVELGASMPFGAEAIGTLIGPLSVGEHHILATFASEEFGFDGSVTYVITVAPRAK